MCLLQSPEVGEIHPSYINIYMSEEQYVQHVPLCVYTCIWSFAVLQNI